MRDPDRELVWSSDGGDLRRRGRGRRARERAAAAAGPDGGAPAAGGRVTVRRETAGRRGRPVTTVVGLPLDDAALRELAGRLKKRCGVGGAAKRGVIELQGDHRDAVVALLRAEGWDAVRAGG